MFVSRRNSDEGVERGRTLEVTIHEGAAVSEPLGHEEAPAQHPLQETRQDTSEFRLGELTSILFKLSIGFGRPCEG